jgi:transposase-like protein
MTCDLTNPIFTDEAAATAHMEADRWPSEITCPLCGVVGEAKKMGGETQAGMFLCNACRGKFTVRTGTVFERSHIPVHKWLLATYLMASSKKGISAHQLHRMLGITYKSAWFMAMRVREAMTPAKGESPLGGPGKVVEADEHYTGRRKGVAVKKGGIAHKMAVVSLVERGGRARSFHVEFPDAFLVSDIVTANVDAASRLHTDESKLYGRVGKKMKRETVNHSRDEYARGDVTTNSVEGYFSVFARGLIGTYQHVSEQHLKRYLAEFDFRQSNRAKLGVTDDVRAARILKGAENKRLTYRQVG